MDCYESCMYSTKIIYVNSFLRGFNSKVSHGLFLINSQVKHFLFDSWRHQEVTSGQLLRKSQYQLQGIKKRRRHGKEGI